MEYKISAQLKGHIIRAALFALIFGACLIISFCYLPR